MHGINNDTRIFILLADLRYQIKAGHIRHTHIQNTHIIVVSANQLQSRSARCSNIGHYRIRHFIHYLANALQYQTVVIDRQDFRLYFFSINRFSNVNRYFYTDTRSRHGIQFYFTSNDLCTLLNCSQSYSSALSIGNKPFSVIRHQQ